MKKFQKDYENSVKIRNRISRFEKDPTKNTSVPKLNRYFQLSSRSTPTSRREDKSLNFTSTEKVLPISKKGFHTASKLTQFSSKLDVMYRKEDIMKNRIV